MARSSRYHGSHAVQSANPLPSTPGTVGDRLGRLSHPTQASAEAGEATAEPRYGVLDTDRWCAGPSNQIWAAPAPPDRNRLPARQFKIRASRSSVGRIAVAVHRLLAHLHAAHAAQPAGCELTLAELSCWPPRAPPYPLPGSGPEGWEPAVACLYQSQHLGKTARLSGLATARSRVSRPKPISHTWKYQKPSPEHRLSQIR